MKTVTRTLSAAALVGAGFLAGASLPASLAHDAMGDRSHAAGKMSGGSMMGGDSGSMMGQESGSMMGQESGSMMGQESGGMMGMMQQMSRMMKNCNEMMESYGDREKDAAPPDEPAG